MATRTGQAARSKAETSRLAWLWQNYSLSITVGALFLTSFVLHTIFGWWQYAADQQAHGSPATFWGWDGYAIYWSEWTFQNWQSEFLEVLLLIVLTKYLVHKGSPESRDSSDEMMAALERIEKKVTRLEGKP